MLPVQPDFIEMPFAQNGGRNEIPASGGADDGLASLDQGFPPITEQPVAQGGLPPRRKDFNGVLYALSSFQFFAQAGGIFTYDASVDYRTPAMVWHANNLYICVGNNGPASTVVTPGSNSNYWKDFIEFLGLGSDGNIVAAKLGTSTVGSNTQGMWLNGGSPQAMTGTVGSASNGIYMDAGIFKACTSSGGSSSGSASNGYLTIGGCLICYGSSSNSSVTFPKAFSATPFVMYNNYATSGSHHLYKKEQYVVSASSTGFTANATPFYYIAIGAV